MSNYCNFELQATAKTKDAIDTLIKALTTSYDYTKDENGEYINYPAHPHFYRIFEFEYTYDKCKNENDEYVYSIQGYGNCAWSVLSCMINTKNSYCNNLEETDENGTHLEELAKKHPDLQIEIISQEDGLSFTERIALKDGNLVKNECCHLNVCYLNTVEDLLDLIYDYPQHSEVVALKEEHPDLKLYMDKIPSKQYPIKGDMWYQKIETILNETPAVIILDGPIWIETDGDSCYCIFDIT